MEPLDQLREWGYLVEVAQEHDGFLVYWIEGFGVGVYVRDDDTNVLAALADSDAHAERELQQSETHEQTQERWVREGKVPTEIGGE